MRWQLALAMLTLCGCCSIRTTPLDRCEDDSLVVNPEHPLHGIPVSLRVPTHLELEVIETTYWEKKFVSGEGPKLVPLSTCRATRSVEHDLCYTERIFLVDPVKPAAGTQQYGFSYVSGDDDASADTNGKGYLRSVNYRIDDQTITESANLVSNVLGLVNAFQTAANRASPNQGSLIATDRTVAYGRFDINSCSFEEEVAGFLDCHVNQVGLLCPVCPKECEPACCTQK